MKSLDDLPGLVFAELLDSAYQGKPIRIVETGCVRDLSTTSEISDGWSTIYIARWVKKHPNCKFSSVDLDANAIDLCHTALEAENLAQYCDLRTQDSLKYLASQSWIDIAYLDSCDGLAHGLEEFRLAASAGASLIIMDDFSTKAATAVNKAREMGWSTGVAANRYSILRRPA
jgi:hypothetical protein